MSATAYQWGVWFEAYPLKVNGPYAAVAGAEALLLGSGLPGAVFRRGGESGPRWVFVIPDRTNEKVSTKVSTAITCNVCQSVILIENAADAAEVSSNHFATTHPRVDVFQGARLECFCGIEHISGWCERTGATK